MTIIKNTIMDGYDTPERHASLDCVNGVCNQSERVARVSYAFLLGASCSSNS